MAARSLPIVSPTMNYLQTSEQASKLIRAALCNPRLNNKPRRREIVSGLLKTAHNIFTIPPMWAPVSIEATLLSQTRRKVRENQIALSSLLWCTSRMVWSSFLAWLLTKLIDRELIGVLCMAYIIGDETPTKCKLAKPKHEHESDIVKEYMQACKTHSSKPEVAKVFQTEYHIVLIVHGPLTGGKHIMLHGELCVPLLTMDHVTAATVHETIMRGTFIPGFIELAPYFLLFLRACTTDGAAYCEKIGFKQLFPEACKFTNECDIHTWNNVLGSSLKTLDADVSG
jgi:hypothetical protein